MPASVVLSEVMIAYSEWEVREGERLGTCIAAGCSSLEKRRLGLQND